jgi:OOP family OmpA-OmpF porin
MIRIFFTCCILIFNLSIHSQIQLKGLWQGLLFVNGAKESESMPFFIEFETNEVGSARSREEIFNTDLYAIQKVKGSVQGKTVKFQQFVMEKKSASSKVSWCSMEASLEYVDSTGYLTGTFQSSSCKRHAGKIILFRSKATFSDKEVGILSHTWRNVFLDDLKNNRKAPEIRDLERKNFKFEVIYFDYDKAEIRSEYHAFLIKMIRVVNGHTDLRIKITGHTDSDGSDAYNDELSKRRAKALKDFFTQNGLSEDRLLIDFKGEKEPVDSNNSPEGKQRNRRVDFEFI